MNEMVSREPPITDKNQHAIRMERVFFILGAMTAFVGSLQARSAPMA